METVQNVTLPMAVVTVPRGGPARSVTNVSTGGKHLFILINISWGVLCYIEVL